MLAVLERIMEEHRLMVDRLKLAGDAISDLEAARRLEKANVAFTEKRSEPFLERLEAVLKELATIEAGVREHYRREEEELPPILGAVLARSLKMQHRHLVSDIESAVEAISRCRASGLSPDDRLNEEMLASALILRIYRETTEHMQAEDVVLAWAKIALEGGRELETIGTRSEGKGRLTEP